MRVGVHRWQIGEIAAGEIERLKALKAAPAQVEAADTARVRIVGELPLVEIQKSASTNTVTVPGGPVTFTVDVLNTSASEALTITSLIDDIYGDLNGQGDCTTPQMLPPG